MRFLAIGHHTTTYTAEAAKALMPAEMRTAGDLYRRSPTDPAAGLSGGRTPRSSWAARLRR